MIADARVEPPEREHLGLSRILRARESAQRGDAVSTEPPRIDTYLLRQPGDSSADDGDSLRDWSRRVESVGFRTPPSRSLSLQAVCILLSCGAATPRQLQRTLSSKAAARARGGAGEDR
mmetsp:Transcript_10809/g.27519  ORF Transcript_10809/g.27519 Transcript_10809/m.27519 type:complete len:119 (-) Transcript_10809:32-388(-)